MISIIKTILSVYLSIGLVHTAYMYASMALGYYAFKKKHVEFVGKNKETLDKLINMYPDITSGGLFKNLYHVCKDIVLWPKNIYSASKTKKLIKDQIKINF